MKQVLRVTGILILLLVTGTTRAGNTDGMTATLTQVVQDKLSAFNREDVSGTLQNIHSRSPQYSNMQQALTIEFEALDARTELVSLYYIGHDDEFAVARVKLKTVDNSGEPFADNVIDTMAVFHQEDGTWKYWSHHVLGVEIVE